MLPPEESHTEIPKSGHRWVDMSVAACALIVSITSLFVAIRHGRSMEKMAEENARLVQANSWPVLQRYQSDIGQPPNEHAFTLYVVNNGVGPAKVESVEVAWKGQPVRNPRELLELCCVKARDPAEEHGVEVSGLMGSVLRAGEMRKILEFPEDPEHAAMTDRLRVSLHDITWRACYCSVFDECWVSNLETLHPQSVKECFVPKVPFGG
jgi:hypothetical protein